jgi:hypothetical protein
MPTLPFLRLPLQFTRPFCAISSLPAASALTYSRSVKVSRCEFIKLARSQSTNAKRMAFPEQVKAILVPKHGEVDVIELGDVPFPEQKPDEVLIKVSLLSHVKTFDNQLAFTP